MGWMAPSFRVGNTSIISLVGTTTDTMPPPPSWAPTVKVTLVAATPDAEVAADEVIPYETEYLATMHNRQYETVAEKLAPSIAGVGSLGADMGGGIGCICALAGSDARDITPFSPGYQESGGGSGTLRQRLPGQRLGRDRTTAGDASR